MRSRSLITENKKATVQTAAEELMLIEDFPEVIKLICYDLKKFIFIRNILLMSYKNVAQILASARDAINQELQNDSDASHHRLKLEASLNREIEYINLLTGIGDVVPDKKPAIGPATTMGGQSIKRPPAKQTSEDLEPEPRAVVELKARVEALWNTFVTRDSKEILKEVDDTTIRGIAKKAKMKVTKQDPEEITLKFIDEIKDAILMEKARIVAANEQAENEKNQPKEETASDGLTDEEREKAIVADLEKVTGQDIDGDGVIGEKAADAQWVEPELSPEEKEIDEEFNQASKSKQKKGKAGK